jgi:hypothetical protein
MSIKKLAKLAKTIIALHLITSIPDVWLFLNAGLVGTYVPLCSCTLSGWSMQKTAVRKIEDVVGGWGGGEGGILPGCLVAWSGLWRVFAHLGGQRTPPPPPSPHPCRKLQLERADRLQGCWLPCLKPQLLPVRSFTSFFLLLKQQLDG